MYVPCCLHRDIHVAVTAHTAGGRRLGERRRLIDIDLPRRGLARRVGDDLQKTRDEPILIDSMVALCGHDVETEVVRVAVGKQGYEGRHIEEVVG